MADRATDERLNRGVAVKVIGADASGADLRRSFLKEARGASAVTHPNIVTIHEVESAGDIDFIVMELVNGRSRLLLLPPDQKRHPLFDGGHMPAQMNDIVREILDWFDRFLGPVKLTARSTTN